MNIQRNRLVKIALLLSLLIGLCLPTFPAAAAIEVTVNTTDDVDDGVCDDSHCSLREAILATNASPGSNAISFQIPGSGVHEIQLTSPLPALAAGTTIAGDSQPGYSGSPVIVLRGGPGVDVGLRIDGGDVNVRGLSLVGFGPVDPEALGPEAGAAILVTASDSITIRDNYIGLLPSGDAVPNGIGVRLEGNGAWILTNVISANSLGVSISGGENNTLWGNRIGTDPSGSAPAGFQSCGIWIGNGAGAVTIGGALPGYGNLISGNGLGILIDDAINVHIVGNRIGTDASGLTAVPNSIGIETHGRITIIGTTATGMGSASGNLISGNDWGIRIATGAEETFIQHNLIGTDISGQGSLPNMNEGIHSQATAGAVIGGFGVDEGNVIQGNGGSGIGLGGNTNGHLILGNTIRQNGGDGIGRSVPNGNNTFRRNSVSGNAGLGITGGWLEIPSLDSVSTSEVSGTAACTHCVIEFFLADDDPSGSGEGMTFLGDTETDDSGAFTTSLDGMGFCSLITATVTTTAGRTSNFAPNERSGTCLVIPHELIPLFVPPWIVFGGVFGLLLGRRPGRRPRIYALGGAGAGLLLGLGLTALLIAMPFVHVPPLQQAQPTPIPTQPGNAEAQATLNAILTQMAATTSTLTPTPTAIATFTPTPSLTAIPGPIYGILTMNAFCRGGPGAVYDVVTGFATGYRGLLDGRNAESTWFRFRDFRCHVFAGALEIEGDANSLPVLPPPPTPTPALGCWVPGTAGNVCTFPCPAGATGGPCTP